MVTLDMWVTLLSLDRDTAALTYGTLMCRLDTWLYNRATPLEYADAVKLDDTLTAGILAGAEPDTASLLNAHARWLAASKRAETNQWHYLHSEARQQAISARRAARGGAS